MEPSRRTRILCCLLTLSLLTVAGFASVAGVSAEMTDGVTVSVAPDSEEALTGSSTELAITVGNVTAGVGAYNLTVTAANSSVATITSFRVAGDPDGVSSRTTADKSSLQVTAYGLDTNQTGTVPVLYLTLAADAVGETALDISVEVIGDEQGNEYTPARTDSGTLTVRESTTTETTTPTATPESENESTATPTATEAGGASGGGGGGGGGGSEEEATYDTFDTDAGSTLRISDLTVGSQLAVPVPGTAGAGVTVQEVGIDMTFASSDFRLELTTPREEPLDNGALPDATAVAYFSITAYQLERDTLDTATVRLRVDDGELPAGVDPSAVTIYRYTDGEWQPTETTPHGDGIFSAQFEGFSEFAVGYSEPSTPTQTTTQTPAAPTETEQDTSGPTASESATAQPEGEAASETAESAPGFGLLLTLVSLLAFARYVAREPRE